MQHHLTKVSFRDAVYDSKMVETFACSEASIWIRWKPAQTLRSGALMASHIPPFARCFRRVVTSFRSLVAARGWHLRSLSERTTDGTFPVCHQHALHVCVAEDHAVNEPMMVGVSQRAPVSQPR